MRPTNEIRINMALTVCYLFVFVDWFSSDIVVVGCCYCCPRDVVKVSHWPEKLCSIIMAYPISPCNN